MWNTLVKWMCKERKFFHFFRIGLITLLLWRLSQICVSCFHTDLMQTGFFRKINVMFYVTKNVTKKNSRCVFENFLILEKIYFFKNCLSLCVFVLPQKNPKKSQKMFGPEIVFFLCGKTGSNSLNIFFLAATRPGRFCRFGRRGAGPCREPSNHSVRASAQERSHQVVHEGMEKGARCWNQHITQTFSIFQHSNI